MWNYIKELPVSLVAQTISPFLDLKSIVMLERGLANHTMQRTIKAFLSLLPTLNIKLKIPNENIKMKWLYDRKVRIRRAEVVLNMVKMPQELCLIDQVHIIIRGNIRTTNINNLPHDIYERVVSITI